MSTCPQTMFHSKQHERTGHPSFFLGTNETERKSQQVRNAPLPTGKPVIRNHLRARGCGTVRQAHHATPTRMRQRTWMRCKQKWSSICTTKHDGLTRIAGWLVPDLGLGDLAQQRHGLHRAPATHFAGKDNQTGAAVRSQELGVRDLFPAPRACKSCTIHPRALWTGSATLTTNPLGKHVTKDDTTATHPFCVPRQV